MLKSLSFSRFLSFAAAFSSVYAATIELDARAQNPYPVSAASNYDTHGFGFTNADNQLYSATLWVNGVEFQVILDTGSSDTWIDPVSIGGIIPPELIYTGYESTTRYVDGTEASGPIVLATLNIGPYEVVNQAIQIANNASFGNPANGLMGLGGDHASNILSILAASQYADNGRTFLSNLFIGLPNVPNYVTWLMSRSIAGTTTGGQLTISQVLSNLTDVLNAPELTSSIPNQWTTFLDGIYVNGQFVNGHSNNSDAFQQAFGISVPSGSTIATFDSGTSFILAPNFYVDAVYKNVPGAKAVTSNGPNPPSLYYEVPCDTKLNITWQFGGKQYPMHPMDAVVADFEEGRVTCAGTIFGGNSNPGEDWLLGDSFLRNVYHLYGYGESGQLLQKPYLKMLSVTDPAKAWAESDAIIQARMQAVASAGTATSTASGTYRPVFTGKVQTASATVVLDTKVTDVPAATSSGARLAGALADDAVTTGSGSSTDISGLTRNSYIIMGLLGGVILLLIAVVVLTVRAGRPNRQYRPLMAGRSVPSQKVFEADSEPFYDTPH